MKTVQLDEVVKYVNSDKWLAQEVSGRLLITLITFMSFDEEFIKVFKVKKTKMGINMIFRVEKTKKKDKKKNYINKFTSSLIQTVFDWL